MQQEKATHHIATLCRVLGVSPDGPSKLRVRSVVFRIPSSSPIRFIR